MKLVFSFSFSPVIASALQNCLREFQVYNLWKHPQEYKWQEFFKYFQNSILLSEQNKLANSRKNIVPDSFKGEFKDRPWHEAFVASSAQIKKKETWAGDKKPVLK